MRQDRHGRPLGEGDIQVETSMRRSLPMSGDKVFQGAGDSQFKSHEKGIGLSSGQRWVARAKASETKARPHRSF